MVLGAAFDIPGVVVDTHVARVSARLGLTANTDPERIETDLMAVLPRKEWSSFSLRVIFFGREICVARKPLSEARVDVVEVPGKPGVYRAVAFLRPHYQLDELTVSMRLVAELPPPAK